MTNGIPVREGWFLVQTCPVAPEQYDLINHKGETLAYMRLRFAYFYVSCPDVNGEIVFDHSFEGNEYKGAFDDDDEREGFLSKAVDAVERWWRAGS